MKIRTALTLRYTCITAAVFLVFITAIYYVSEHSRSNAFFRNLKSEAITKAHLFLNNQVDAETMQSIYRIKKEKRSTFFSAIPVPFATLSKGSSAIWNGILILSVRRLSKPRSKAPPPAK